MATREDIKRIFPEDKDKLNFYDDIMAWKPLTSNQPKNKKHQMTITKIFFGSDFFSLSLIASASLLIVTYYIYVSMYLDGQHYLEVYASSTNKIEKLYVEIASIGEPYFIALISTCLCFVFAIVWLNVKRWNTLNK